MTNNLTAEERKLAELILYISGKCLTHERFGATKLNKILFFSDFIFFKQHGRAITGVDYFKLPQGPAPKCLLKVRESMVSERDLAIAHRPLPDGRIQQRTIPLRASRISEFFDAEEIDVVNQVIDILWDKSAEEVSELSHLYVIGWKLYDLKDIIPYHSVFGRIMSDEYVTALDLERAEQVAKKHGLLKTSSIPKL